MRNRAGRFDLEGRRRTAAVVTVPEGHAAPMYEVKAVSLGLAARVV
jgi:hypothetical protein